MKFGDLKVGSWFHKGDEESGRFGTGILKKIPPEPANVRGGFANARPPGGGPRCRVCDDTPVKPVNPIQTVWRQQ